MSVHYIPYWKGLRCVMKGKGERTYVQLCRKNRVDHRCLVRHWAEAFAHILAARGMNLVLVARSEDKLCQLSQQLSEQHGIRADVVPADLCLEGAVQEVYRRTQALDVPVDLLVNNAGFGTYGGFADAGP